MCASISCGFARARRHGQSPRRPSRGTARRSSLARFRAGTRLPLPLPTSHWSTTLPTVPSDFQGRTTDPSPCSAADPRAPAFARRTNRRRAHGPLMGSRDPGPGRTRNTTVETANRRNKIHHWAHPNPTEPAAVMARHSRECVLVFHSTDPLAGALVLRYPLRTLWSCTNPSHGNV